MLPLVKTAPWRMNENVIYCHKTKGVDAMAQKKRKKQCKQLQLGLLAVALGLAALLPVAAVLQKQFPQTLPEPAGETTEAPAITHPTLPENPYHSTDFQYAGDYLSCLTADSRLGIDVSSHQGVIDWQQVAASGVEFAMIRLGYRGYETGVIKVDDYARSNLAAAREAGLDVGVYFFSQAITAEEARQEANFVLAVLEEAKLQMPVVFDWELIAGEARTGGIDSRTLTDCAIAFCQVIQDAGYEPMVYFNQHLAEALLNLEELTEYEFWLAMYTDQMTYPYRIRMWQYTEEGTVPGIDGSVDINLWLP